jgi:hypothetical protein
LDAFRASQALDAAMAHERRVIEDPAQPHGGSPARAAEQAGSKDCLALRILPKVNQTALCDFRFSILKFILNLHITFLPSIASLYLDMFFSFATVQRPNTASKTDTEPAKAPSSSSPPSSVSAPAAKWRRHVYESKTVYEGFMVNGKREVKFTFDDATLFVATCFQR